MAEGDNQFGYGQQHPSDAASDYNVEKFVIDQALAGISTMKMVKVTAVDAGAKTVDVQILTKLIDGSGNVTDQGTVFGIPYITAQWGKSAVKGTPAVDDMGMMVCADRDISAVKAAKGAAQPGSNRKFSPADGVYICGLMNKDPEQFIEFKDDGGTFTFKGDKVLTVDSTAGWNFKGKVTFQDDVQLGGSIKAAGGGTYDKVIQTTANISTTGDVVAGTISLKAHRTLGVTIGTGTSGLPTP
jgi:hypothetical protein